MASTGDNGDKTAATPAPHDLSDPKAVYIDEALRYLGYGGRLRTIAIATSRYLAFTSDLGEAFRPIIHPRFVTATYAVSWLYCSTDVALYAYRDWAEGSTSTDISRTVVERTIFQSVASMGLPALTIHTTVRVFGHIFKKFGRYQRWGPTAMGLAVIPFLPVYDHPVEHTLNRFFDRYWPRGVKSLKDEEKID